MTTFSKPHILCHAIKISTGVLRKILYVYYTFHSDSGYGIIIVIQSRTRSANVNRQTMKNEYKRNEN